jgi:hypothetical protein
VAALGQVSGLLGSKWTRQRRRGRHVARA